MSLGYSRDRKRSHFWRRLFRWLVVLALGLAAGLLAERYGSILAGRSVAEFEAEVGGLFETVAELEIANARLQGTVEADAVRIAELERRYERDVAPTEARNCSTPFATGSPRVSSNPGSPSLSAPRETSASARRRPRPGGSSYRRPSTTVPTTR